MSIEGVPEGWELVRFGTPALGEFYLNPKHGVCESKEEATCIYPILKRKPKRCRPFANAEEFKPHRDRWVRVAEAVDEDIVVDDDEIGNVMSVTGYNDGSVCIWGGWCIYKTAFDAFEFEDGTPFGIEVAE